MQTDAERFDLLSRTMNEGLVVVDTGMRMVFVNDRFCRMVGYRRSELLGRPGADLLDAANRKIAWLQLHQRSKGIVRTYELVFTRKNGRFLHTLVSPGSIVDSEGRFAGSISVVTDITQLKQTEESLRQAQAELEARVEKRTADLARANRDLLAEAAQRRRTEEALQAARLKLEMTREEHRRRLSRDLHDSVGQRLVVARLKIKEIAGAAQALADGSIPRLVQELSDHLAQVFTEVRQIGRALYPPSLEALGLPAALRQLAKECSLPGVPVVVKCDDVCSALRSGPQVEIALYRVAQEAIANALRHGKPKRIDVRLTMDQGAMRLRIIDDGCGLRPRRPKGDGVGIASMQDRAAAIGATFGLTSRRGRTCVEAAVHLAAKGKC